jgi:hypothetical protein
MGIYRGKLWGRLGNLWFSHEWVPDELLFFWWSHPLDVNGHLSIETWLSLKGVFIWCLITNTSVVIRDEISEIWWPGFGLKTVFLKVSECGLGQQNSSLPWLSWSCLPVLHLGQLIGTSVAEKVLLQDLRSNSREVVLARSESWHGLSHCVQNHC